MHILVVDQDPSSNRITSHVLAEEGYQVSQAFDGSMALSLLQERVPSLVVLDPLLPDVDGFDLCRRIRRSFNVPIIFLSERAALDDKVTGLRNGGDDYLAQPCAPAELLARIGAVLRRYQSALAPAWLTVAGYTIDPVTHRIARPDGQEQELSPIEFRLLHYLMQHVGSTVSPGDILAHVWGYSYGGEGNLVAVAVRRLRAKVERVPERPEHILTIRNVGYMFQA
jgi:DNA-binding response OmpR family regulator